MMPALQATRLALRERSFAEGIFFLVAIAMCAALIDTALLWAVDTRTIDGLSVWAKPMKFELALALHAGTLGLVVARMGPSYRYGKPVTLVASAFFLACLVEMGWIIGQGAQGLHSHFNDSSALHRVMFSVMALCAVVITGAAGMVGLLVWRDRDYRAAIPVKAGIVLGLLGGTVLTIFTAFAIGGHGGPYTGAVPAIDARMFLTGWSRTGGDLRVAHFLATHMIQAIPLIAIIACLLAPARLATAAIVVASVSWAGWTLFEHDRAMSGAASILTAFLP